MADRQFEQLYGALETQHRIEALAHTETEALFLSAFFSEPAFRWMEKLENVKDVKLVVRASPDDVIFGACDLAAIRRGLHIGWQIRFMASLHAKVYLFGNHIVIGSGNLTANGLALHGTGNLELNTIIRATPEATDLLNGIFDQAQAFDIDLLDRMEAYLDSQPQNKNYMGWWPKNVVPPVIRSLYCNDLPVQDHFSLSKYENEPWNSIQQQISERRFENARDLLTSSFAYRWLKTKLLENENELYFGKISSQLHNELADDPAPYRADVKSLLANLLAVINEIPECEIVVDRPRHSQRVRLSNKN